MGYKFFAPGYLPPGADVQTVAASDAGGTYVPSGRTRLSRAYYEGDEVDVVTGTSNRVRASTNVEQRPVYLAGKGDGTPRPGREEATVIGAHVRVSSELVNHQADPALLVLTYPIGDARIKSISVPFTRRRRGQLEWFLVVPPLGRRPTSFFCDVRDEK